jgi:NhaC family Na+:H+ antiporter
MMHTNPATLKESIGMVTVLVIFILLSVLMFGEDAIGGPLQLALTASAFVGICLGLFKGYKWKELEKAVSKAASIAITPIFILLSVGALVGTWIMCGTVPSLIHYGLKILSPAIFFPTACLLCAFVSISIGSSWTTMATVGVALLGVSLIMGLSTPVTVGAIVSGSYFGDKMSPLSDTTNLASAVAGSELFAHIRHMMWVSIPSFVIALALYTLIGFIIKPDDISGGDMAAFNTALSEQFNLGIHLLIPMAILLYMAYRQAPALPTIFLGAVVGGIFAVFFQPDLVSQLADSEGGGSGYLLTKGVMMAMFDGYRSQSGVAEIDSLLSKGGMSSMLTTVWLILSAMLLSGVLTCLGVLETITRTLIGLTKRTGDLIATTLANCFLVNILTGEQVVSLVLPGQIWRAEYKKRNLAGVNLSRCLEDAGTLTTPLVPWSSCGAYIYGVLGLTSFAYIPFCFFNIINPIISAIYGYLGFTIIPDDLNAASPAVKSTA